MTKIFPGVNQSPLHCISLLHLKIVSLNFLQQQLKLQMKLLGLMQINPVGLTAFQSVRVAILKAIKHVISAPHEIVFNASFSTGIVSDLFTIAKVTPVFKKRILNF